MSDFTIELDPGLRLRSLWQKNSRRSGWRFPDDWLVPEVEGVIRAYEDGEHLHHAAIRLASSRARQGVGIRETMLDFEAFFEAVRQQVDAQAMQALVESWVAENERIDPFRSPSVNAGIVTSTYFQILTLDLSLAPQDLLDSVTVAALHLEWATDDKRLPQSVAIDIRTAFSAEFASIDATATINHAEIRILMPRSNEGYSALLRFINCLELLSPNGTGRTLIRFLSLPLDSAAGEYVR